MSASQFPKRAELNRALELCRRGAERGKDSFFSAWWFFDTNCVSELVKLYQQGMAHKVHTFVGGKDILITSTVLQELRKAPGVLGAIDAALASAKVCLLPDVTRFWYTDILNFVNVDRIPINSLEVFPAPIGFFKIVTRRADFEQACSDAELDVQRRFLSQVEPDVGAALDERDLCVYIYSVVNKCGNEWFHIDIPPGDFRPANFPSFYVFYYAYYFRYVRNRDVRPELNDFIDLADTMAAPYCEKYFCEASFASVLRNDVQGREPPPASRLLKKTYKKGLVTKEVYDTKRRKEIFGRTSPLLESTTIVSFAEMRAQILAT